MNILPHKSWHVRTKKNIARVRKDEAKAAEEEKETQRRVALAGQEARTAFLRERAGQRLVDRGEESSIPLASCADIVQKDGHVNFFQEIEEGKKQGHETNADHEEEKKKEQEDYEKKIGYLVHLGQNSKEHSKEIPWYEKIDRKRLEDDEKGKFKSAEEQQLSTLTSSASKSQLTNDELKLTKNKNFHDPLKDIRKYLETPGVKKKMEEAKRKRVSSPIPSQSTSTSAPKKRKKEKKKKKSSHKHKEKKSKHKKSKKESKIRESSASSSGSESSDDYEAEKKRKLEKLRQERLDRERAEKRRTELVLAKARGEVLPEDKPAKTEVPGRKQKYNSQFNPHLARQNYD